LIDEGKSHDILGGLKEISRIILKKKAGIVLKYYYPEG